MGDPIVVSQHVAEVLEEIRESGECNMFDRRCIQAMANELESFAVVMWLEDHPKDYAKAIIDGFTTYEED